MEATLVHPTNVSLTLRLTDATKLPMLLDLLRHLDFIEAAEPVETSATPATAEATPGASVFHAMAGIWEGRDIDLQELRNDAFLRRTVNYAEQS